MLCFVLQTQFVFFLMKERNRSVFQSRAPNRAVGRSNRGFAAWLIQCDVISANTFLIGIIILGGGMVERYDGKHL